MKTFIEYIKKIDSDLGLYLEKKWIQDAINPKHKGFCTPITKKTCTGKRKAFALRAKKGDIHDANMKKKKKKG